MRANEFLNEDKFGSMPGTFSDTLPPSFSVLDRYYGLYRMAMMMAGAPDEMEAIDSYNWISDSSYVSAYTDEEMEIIKKAAKKMGLPVAVHTKSKSQESDGVNTQSITKPFNGY